MTYPTRRARIEAEKAQMLAQRSQRSKRFSLGVAGLATAASATFFGMAPANAAIEDTPAPASASSTSANTAQSAGTYTVKAGDTLSSIASSQGVSLNALMSENGLSGSSIIYPGEVLQLPGGSSGSASSADTSSNGSTSSQGDRTSAQLVNHSTASGSPIASDVSKAVSIVNSGAGYKGGGNGPSPYGCTGFARAALTAEAENIARTSAGRCSGASSP